MLFRSVERKPNDNEPLSMLAFKIMSFEHVGSLTFCRIYSGKIEQGMALYRLAGADVDTLVGFAIERARQIVDNGVEQRLHALVLEG